MKTNSNPLLLRKLANAFILVCGATFTTLSSADLVDVIDPQGPGSVIVNPSLPDHISKNPNNGDLVIWEEAQNLLPDADLLVDNIFSASPFVFSEEGKHYISAGALVSSHLIQWDPPKKQ
ncbi:MAG: hypothetical protein AAGB46_13000 [Verrucomicrobiota bacterium]